MNKATREELLAAMAKYDAANAAFNAAPRIGEFESMPEWDALGVARDNLRVVERSYHSRRRKS